MFSISENGPPLRWSTVRQSSSGSSANASSGSASTTIHDGSSQLGLELARAPARVAREEAQALDREVVRLGVGGHEADALR